MTRYSVEVTTTARVLIEANSAKEAEDIAVDTYDSSNSYITAADAYAEEEDED